MARMKDVAERCGVAESTVSHVLNNTKHVSPEVKERVLRAMRELNFHGNAHARRLARGYSDFLGLIISDIENPFFPGLIKAFESAALQAGFDVLLATTNYEPERTQKAFQKMIENKAPAVAVMTSRIDPERARQLDENGVAAVFLDSGGIGPRRSNIRLDYAKGTYEAINYLHNLGHRDFAYVSGPQNRPSHVAYREAVRSALDYLDLRPRIIDGENTVVSGEQAMRTLLTARPLPTAVLCSNDLTAIGVLGVLLHAGIQVPDDISVVGADDIPYASYTHPPLTTVQIPRERLGTLAFEILQKMLREEAPGSETTLDTQLILRESTGVARGAGVGSSVIGGRRDKLDLLSKEAGSPRIIRQAKK